VINSNWYPISCRFGVIAAYCSNFWHFVLCSKAPGKIRLLFSHVDIVLVEIADGESHHGDWEYHSEHVQLKLKTSVDIIR